MMQKNEIAIDSKRRERRGVVPFFIVHWEFMTWPLPPDLPAFVADGQDFFYFLFLLFYVVEFTLKTGII